MLKNNFFDNDKNVEAVPAATIVVVRERDGHLETLLMERNPELRHMGGFWVYPGGKVDDCDPGASVEECARSAAVRELMEEAEIPVSTDDLLDFSHWLTPEGAPRRFATWFYLAVVPSDVEAKHDGSEIVSHRWVRPEEMIEEQRTGDIKLAPPTLVSLYDLAEYDSIDALIKGISSRTPPYFFPRVIKRDDGMYFLYPGDSGYEDGDPDQNDLLHRVRPDQLGYRYFHDARDVAKV